MRKIYALLLLFLSISIYGQYSRNSEDRGRFGLKAGGIYSSLLSSKYQNNANTGFTVGIFHRSKSLMKFSFAGELMYSTFSTTTSFVPPQGNYKESSNFSVISYNVLPNFYVHKNVSFQFGLSIGYFLGGSVAEAIPKKNTADYFIGLSETADLPMELAIPVGINYDFSTKVTANLRYQVSVLSPYTISLDEKAKISNLSLTVGYAF